jgi:hypothetical protein
MDTSKSLDWLLANASPCVKYLARRDLLRADPASAPMRRLWAEVEECDEARDIFGKQNEDGSWFVGGSWANRPAYRHRGKEPYSPISPKYVTTTWILQILGEMGFTVADERVRKACEWALAWPGPDGIAFVNGCTPAHEQSYRRDFSYSCFGPGRYLLALSKVGMAQDPRLAKSFDLVAALQREDGGWVNQHHLDGTHAPYTKWTRSCPYATFHAAAALHASRNPRYHEPLRRALRFLVWHLGTKPESDIQRPFYHGHQTVRELLMLSEMRIGLEDPPVRVLLNWLAGMYVPDDGRFRYNGKPIGKHTARADKVAPRALKYWVYHVIEDDWLTYHALRILVKIQGQR